MYEQLINEILPHYTGKRILVTGASGYLATNLVNLLQNINCTIIRLTRDSNTLASVNGIADIVDLTGDIRSKETWKQALEDVNIVYHFASQTSVYMAEKDPGTDLQSNVMPMLNLLETCRIKCWCPIIIFSGTVTEAGIPDDLPVDETHKDQPITIYDIHKLMAETYLKHYIHQGIVHGTVLRLANVYGPGPSSSSADRGVINMMMRKALAGESLTIYGKGKYLRDYIHIEDVVQAFIKVPINIDQADGKHFVIGSGDGHTIAEAVNMVADRVALKTGKRVSAIHVDPPLPLHPIEFRNFIANPQAFIDATGWKSNYALLEGIDSTINSFLETSEFLKAE